MESEKNPWWADDIKDAWKWLANWISLILGGLPQLYDNWPWLQQNMTIGMLHWIITILAAGGVINTMRYKDSTVPAQSTGNNMEGKQ